MTIRNNSHLLHCIKDRSADIKMKNYELKTSFASVGIQSLGANKTGNNLMIY